MPYHPDTRPDEQFIGNHVICNPLLSDLTTLSTLRFGAIAYDLDGKQISPNYMRPMFIGRSEYDHLNRIHEQEMERIGKRLPGGHRAYSAQQLEILATIAGQES